MNKKWLAVIGIASVLAVIGLTGCEQGSVSTGEIGTITVSNQQQGIWVSGTGEMTVTPDIATINVGIESEDASVAAAREEAAEAMQHVMDALLANGVAEKDIQTQYFSINQVTNWDRETGEEIVEGYRVSNTVTVTIRNIDNTGTIIDAAAAAGGNDTRINGVNFSVDDPSAYYDEVRETAVADAKAKAEELASLAGVSLGKVTYISEGSYNPPSAWKATGMAYAEASDAAYPTQISPGELEITLNVQIAYAVK